jgi:hypothetical protein
MSRCTPELLALMPLASGDIRRHFNQDTQIVAPDAPWMSLSSEILAVSRRRGIKTNPFGLFFFSLDACAVVYLLLRDQTTGRLRCAVRDAPSLPTNHEELMTH